MKVKIPKRIGTKENKLRKIPAFAKKSSIDLTPAAVLTGTNGSGKTSLIMAIAASFKMGSDLSSLKESLSDSAGSFDVRASQSTYGVVETDEEFDEIFRYRSEYKGRGWVSSMDDLQQVFLSNRSHGQSNIAKLHEMVLGPAANALVGGKKVLILLDEPEVGLSIDVIQETCLVLWSASRMAVNKKRPIMIIVATQSPFVAHAMLAGGAKRIDLGWKDNACEDPLGKLIESISIDYESMRKNIYGTSKGGSEKDDS